MAKQPQSRRKRGDGVKVLVWVVGTWAAAICTFWAVNAALNAILR